MKNRQHGFSIIELCLVILVIVVVCAVGLLSYKKFHRTIVVGPNNRPSISSSAWKTFNWTYEGLSIKYPSSWTTYNPQAPRNLQVPTGTNSPVVFFYSPHLSTYKGYALGSDPSQTDTYTGSFSVQLSVSSPSENECNAAQNSELPNAPDPDYIVKIIPFNVPRYKQMEIIEDGGTTPVSAAELALTDQSVSFGKTTAPYLQDIYMSKKHSGQYACIEAGFFAQAKDVPGTSGYIILPKATFENAADYMTSLNIIRSTSY